MAGAVIPNAAASSPILNAFLHVNTPLVSGWDAGPFQAERTRYGQNPSGHTAPQKGNCNRHARIVRRNIQKERCDIPAKGLKNGGIPCAATQSRAAAQKGRLIKF